MLLGIDWQGEGFYKPFTRSGMTWYYLSNQGQGLGQGQGQGLKLQTQDLVKFDFINNHT